MADSIITLAYQRKTKCWGGSQRERWSWLAL